MNDTDKIMALADSRESVCADQVAYDKYTEAMRESIDRLTQQLADARSESTALRVNEQNLTERLDELIAEQASQPEDFDAWGKNPYTQVLQKTITEDYVPKTAQPAAPVAIVVDAYETPGIQWLCQYPPKRGDRLYTAPPQPAAEPAQREWIGLTDDDLRELFTQDRAFDRLEKFSRIIAARLREKNGSKP